MNIKLPPIDFRSVFYYDQEQGVLTRIATGKPAWVKFSVHKAPHKQYCYVKHQGKEYAAHRVIWAVVHGEWPETSLDHIDHNKRNNRIDNLRLATHVENSRNLSRYINNTSGQNGITKTRTGKFQVRLGYGNERKCLGTYDNIEEAVAVRDAVLKVLKFHPNHGC